MNTEEHLKETNKQVHGKLGYLPIQSISNYSSSQGSLRALSDYCKKSKNKSNEGSLFERKISPSETAVYYLSVYALNCRAADISVSKKYYLLDKDENMLHI